MPGPLHPHPDHHAFLRDLAESLGRAVADNGGGVLVHVRPAPAGPDVGFLPLDGAAPAEILLGAVAPDDWSALGVATGGWAHRLDRTGRRARVRAEVVVLVARDGHVVSRVRHGDDVLTEPPASGLTLDGLQRALGLPTAPPDVPTAHLFAAAWLERAVEAGRARPLSWAEVLDLYPGPLETGCDWGQLRWRAVEGRWHEPGLTPTDAAWFDDGSFSRWVLGRRTPLPGLLAELARVVGRREARRCAALLREAGIETAA